jgi:hypothetical protein
LPVYNSRERAKSAQVGVVKLAHFVKFVIPGTVCIARALKHRTRQ